MHFAPVNDEPKLLHPHATCREQIRKIREQEIKQYILVHRTLKEDSVNSVIWFDPIYFRISIILEHVFNRPGRQKEKEANV